MAIENKSFLTNLQKKITDRIRTNQSRQGGTSDLLQSLNQQVEENIKMLHGSRDKDVPVFISNHMAENLDRKQESTQVPQCSQNQGKRPSQTEATTPITSVGTQTDGLLGAVTEAPPIRLLDRKKIKTLAATVNQSVFGQDDVIAEVVDILKVAALNIRSNKSKPAGIYMFAGPSGVGKTELAITLSGALEVPILKINMGEYGLEQDVTKLIGTSPGYVGYQEGGVLTNFVSQNKRSVILLDEVEKAHHSMDKILLSIMDYGVCSDNKGNDIKFDQTIVICTSNLGSNVEYIEGLNSSQKNELRMDTIRHNMRPEIINRFDSIFHFHSLSKEIYEKIAIKFMSSIQKNIKEEHGFDLKYTEKMMQFIVDKSFDPAMGGRPARRFIEKIVIKPLADYMLDDNFEHTVKEHKEVTLDINREHKIYFKGKNRKILGVLENTGYLVGLIEQGKISKKTKP